MSNTNVVSGGKTWEIPVPSATKATPKPANADFSFMDFVSSGFFAFSALGLGAFALMILRFNPLKSVLPANDSGGPADASTGFPIIANVSNDIGYLIFLALGVAWALVFFGVRVWHKKKIRLALFTFAFITALQGSSIMAYMMDHNSGLSGIEWMHDRYGFTPSGNEKAINLSEGEYLVDPTTKTVAKVEMVDSKFYLYDMNGKELPVK